MWQSVETWLIAESGWPSPLGTIVAVIVAVCSTTAFVFSHFAKRRVVETKNKLDQNKEELRLELLRADIRLKHVNPERFLDEIEELYNKAEFAKVEARALDFTTRQSEAFGEAAEYLAEQRILDSDEHGQGAAEEAVRFAEIGRAAFPDSKRLAELADLAARRSADVARGDPIEALNMDGMSDVELNRLSIQLSKHGKYALAEVAARRSVLLALLDSGEMSANYAAALGQHAEVLRQQADFALAEPLYREALEIGRKTLGEAHPAYAIRLNNLAELLRETGRYEEAEPFYREALEIDRKTLGEAHPDYAIRLNNLALLLQATGRYEEAEPLYRETLEIDRKTLGETHPDYAIHLNNLAGLLHKTGRYEKAEPFFREALVVLETALGVDQPTTKKVAEKL